MSEEAENNGGFFGQLKNQVMTGAGVILTGIGTMFMDEVKSFIGIEDEEPAQTEQVKVEANQSQQQSNNQSVIINIPEQKPVEKTVIVKEVEKKPVKKLEKEQEIDW